MLLRLCQMMFFNLLIQAGSVNPQPSGCFGSVISAMIQGLADRLFFRDNQSLLQRLYPIFF